MLLINIAYHMLNGPKLVKFMNKATRGNLKLHNSIIANQKENFVSPLPWNVDKKF
ncbi:MAG: hypothetical protein KAH13_00650 [Tenericutes bacterium]|nr:hypothetical protein [Mycoplasmatota bacterium]